MKKVNASEMRAVDGGVTYITACGATFTDKNPWELLKGRAHVYYCDHCMIWKGRVGYWYTFNTASARKKAPWY